MSRVNALYLHYGESFGLLDHALKCVGRKGMGEYAGTVPYMSALRTMGDKVAMIKETKVRLM